MLLFLSISGIFLSILLLYYNSRKFTSSIYLSGFFFTLSYQVFLIYVFVYSKSVLLISIFLVNFSFLLYFIGPMLYWYIRSILTDNPRLTKKDLLHLLPALIFLVASLEYIFTPYSFKLDIARQAARNSDVLLSYAPTLLIRIFSSSGVSLSRSVIALFYIIWSAVLLISYLRKKDKILVLSGQRYMISWLFHLLGLFFILALSHLLILSHSYHSLHTDLFHTLNLLQVLSGIGLAGLLISPFFFPGILFGLPQLPESFIQLKKGITLDAQSHEGEKRQSQNLESHYLEMIEEKTERCMQDSQPYLKEDFNLVELSFLIQVPAHHIAYYFREEKKQSFNEYRNRLRVEHAKNLIREGMAHDMTLEAIGKLSGFATRNTFFIAFKKFEGVSPGVYVSKAFKDGDRNPQ